MSTDSMNRRLSRDLSDDALLRLLARGEPNPAAFLADWPTWSAAEQLDYLNRIARGPTVH